MVSQRVRSSFAGWSQQLTDQPKLPTLRNFGLALVSVLLVTVGMVQVRAAVWLDAALLVGGGLLLWQWRMGNVDRQRVPVIGVAQLYLPRWWLGGVLALVAVGVAAWAWRNLSVDFTTSADWLWYVASIALLLIAAAVMERAPGGSWQRPRLGGTGWALLCVVVIGLLARTLWLNSLPFGTWYDEAANGLEAMRVANEFAYRPIYTDGVNSTGHYLWLIVGAFKLFGENTIAVRSISAVMGIATVVAAYFAGRELHGNTLGLTWAMLVAVARWSITFSRLGMYNSATPLFEVLALLWLLRGLRRGSVLDFTLAGVAIGLGLCFYSAFQLFLGVLSVVGVVVAWQERGRWRTLVGGLAICVVAALLVVAPLVKYVLAKPEQYFSRVQTTSLFMGKAPEDRLPALWANTTKHLLMFNVSGDPNGRHNLPGEPMLDWVSGGLLIVGLAASLRRGIAPRFLIVPVWIVVGLLGGILSLDFEAPQSLRAIGALPAVLLCAAIPAAQMANEWRRGAGKYFPQGGLWIVGLALLAPAGVLNLQTYFVRQASDFASWNAHSTPETIAAQLLRDADPAVEKYVISLFDGHPTVRFLAAGVPYRRVETNTTLPLLREMPNGMLLVLDTERSGLYEDARKLYPSGSFEEIRSPTGGPVVVYASTINGEVLQSVQGLVATYAGDDTVVPAQTRKELGIDFDWPAASPVAPPFVVDWQGVLAANVYGPYQFFVQAPSHVTVWIDETVLIEGDASEVDGLAGGVMLARGHHNLHVRAESGEGRVRLAWQPPDGPPETIPSWALYVPPVQINGLLGRYFSNGEWSGEPTFAQIDPRLSMYFHIPTLPRPYTVEWSGKLAIPEAGQYVFALQSIDEAVLSIDGAEVVASRVRNEMAQGSLMLDAGLHDVEMRYADRTDHTYINLSWRPPGNDPMFRTIPSELLFPPQGNFEQVDVADLARFVQGETIMPTEVVRSDADPAQVDVMATGLAQPRGVVVSNGVVYVAEMGERRVIALDAESGELIASPFDSLTLVEPFDLALQPDGAIVVLDAGSGQLLRYDPVAGVIATMPISKEYVERSRGIGAGQSGEIWIANTPGQRIAAFDAAGTLLQEVALPAVAADGKEMQPVDIERMADNTLYVTDVAQHILYRFSLAGFLLSSQPIPVANSLDSAHLAADRAGMLYMTEPESGRVVRLDMNGIVDRIWNVRVPEALDAKPVGIGVDAEGAVWVADSQGGRVLRITPETIE